MVAEIGVMVGLYIMTKMLALEISASGKVSSPARVLAAVTFIVTTLIVVDLVYTALTSTAQLPVM